MSETDAGHAGGEAITMTPRTRSWTIAVGLALLAPLVMLAIEVGMFYLGVGSFSTLMDGLAGKESVDDVSVEDYYNVIVPVGDRYLFEQLYVLGPIVIVLVTLAYALLVAERKILHSAFLALPLALYVSWPLWYRFVTAWAVYFGIGLLVATTVGALRRKPVA